MNGAIWKNFFFGLIRLKHSLNIFYGGILLHNYGLIMMVDTLQSNLDTVEKISNLISINPRNKRKNSVIFWTFTFKSPKISRLDIT